LKFGEQAVVQQEVVAVVLELRAIQVPTQEKLLKYKQVAMSMDIQDIQQVTVTHSVSKTAEMLHVYAGSVTLDKTAVSVPKVVQEDGGFVLQLLADTAVS
jgi:hypothetical protein